jgi:hypothetical protein
MMNDLLLKYPASGSCEKGIYRVHGEGDLEEIQDKIYKACNRKFGESTPLQEFRSYTFLNWGWEWSVFRHNDEIIKVPAGIFPDVSDPKYLQNAKHNYSVIQKYLDPAFLAKTEFCEGSPNIIRQRELKPIPKRILFKTCDRAKWLLLFEQLLKLLNGEAWLPDLDIKLPKDTVSENSTWFEIHSVMMGDDEIPQIMDFTAYFDVFRLYKERTDGEVKVRREILSQIIARLKA